MVIQSRPTYKKTATVYAWLTAALCGAITGIIWQASVGHLYYAWQLPQGKIQQDVTITGQVVRGGCISLRDVKKLKSDSDTTQQNSPLRVRHYVAVVQTLNGQPIGRLFNSDMRYIPLHWLSQFTVKLSHRKAYYPANPLSDSFANEARNNIVRPLSQNDQHLASSPLSELRIPSLSCLHNGDFFEAVVKLKPAYGVANPVGFNLQKYLVSRHIHATGYIKQLLQDKTVHRHGIREILGDNLALLELDNERWWFALLLGIRQQLTKDDWLLLQSSGTGHLFSISGMHLGIIAASVLLVTMVGMAGITVIKGTKLFVQPVNKLISPWRAWRVTGYPLAVRFCALAIVVGCCWVYMGISGHALPVVRAFVLLVISCLLALLPITMRPLHVVLFMLSASIMLFPLGVLSASFYLSIGAVLAIIFYVARFRLHHKPWYVGAFQLQCLLCITLLPMTVLWFGNGSLISLFANLIAVPAIVSLLPVALLLLLFLSLFPIHSPIFSIAKALFDYVDMAMGLLISALQSLAALPFSSFAIHWQALTVCCVIIFLIVCFLPPWRYKKVVLLVLFVGVATAFIPVNSNQWALHVLDAGQASAITITKGRRAIVIDSGAQYMGNATTANTYLLPLLRSKQVNAIDHVIHTHSDNDHAGGYQVIANAPEAKNATFYSPTNGCERGTTVNWQGLEIAFLWPLTGNQIDSNATSCVVRVSDGQYSVLIPGDIERKTEYALLTAQLRDNVQPVKSDILIAPHHGSKTSSTGVFIQSVSPYAVIHTQGFENRWAFPAKQVFNRYQHSKVKQFLSSYHGYVSVNFTNNGICPAWTLGKVKERCERSMAIHTQRRDITRRWYLLPRMPSHLN
ncbi:DNA internalization-related competence protein ComEC/Rec2 [Alteromonas sp. D210916BOD_24]|uniref:DNA internalization-related competence protein ComEC/Rec2 n=1 Tax=Alteromonas sp. D210916BOD_24 TaxID=3157618 RepID=UPI00399CE8F2